MGIQKAPASIRRNPDVFAAVLERNVSAMGLGRGAIQRVVHCFHYCDMERDDILAVVEQIPDVFRFIADGDKWGQTVARVTKWACDKDVLLTAIRGGAADALEKASASLHQNRDFVLTAVQINGDALKGANKNFKDDEGVVL